MPLTASSQATQPIAEMTLNDCLLYARTHAHTNRINRMRIRAAQADKRIAAADLMPYIGFGTNGSLSFGRNIDPETNTYDNKQTLGTGFGLDLSLPLFDGLVRINNLKALKTAELRYGKSAQMEEDKVSLEVVRNFYNVTYSEALVEQMERQLSRDSTDLAATRIGERLGTKSGADVAELEAVVASDNFELINQRNILEKAYLDLRSSMGMPLSDSPLLITGIPDSEFTPEITDSYASPITYNRHEIPVCKNLPDIEEAELSVRESRHYLNAAKGGYSPRLSFSTGISTSYYRMMGTQLEVPNFSRQFRDNMGEYLSFNISIPIFDGLATANRVRRASANLRESEIRLEQRKYEIQKATNEARLDRIAAEEELTSARARLEAEKTAYAAIRRKYELGVASVIDLYTSGSKLAIAEAALTGKRIQLAIAEITLRYYLGFPLINDDRLN